MKGPREAFVVSHTHWDREWYLTFNRYRVWLLDVVSAVLERLEGDADFRHFLLDGQAVVLEDYLEARPEDRGRVERLVRDGRLSIGPFYVLPDEFLVSGEALVRNLLLGHQACRAMGGVQRVGYLPDSFGHVAQMPQILSLAGIDSFFYTRGNGDEIDDLGLEFLWRAPDGSEVLAVNQCGGYCNAGGLGYEEIWHAHTRREVDVPRAVEQVRGLFARIAERSNGDLFLLMNGCDHFPPQPKLGVILAALEAAFPDTRFVHTSLAEYLAALRAAKVATKRFNGELRHGKLHPILSGVWSARTYLKVENDRAQELLEGTLEPFLAHAHFTLGRPWPAGLLTHVWKLLLKNHPHDSICGCSVDEVHREMLPRFAGVVDTAEHLLARELNQVVPMFGRQPGDDRETVLAVANPYPEPRREPIERLVVFQPFGVDPDDLELADEAGRPVPFEVLGKWWVERFWGVDYRAALTAEEALDAFRVYRERFGERILRPESEKDRRDCYVHLRFLADVPALGHALYHFRPRAGERAVPSGTVRAAGDTVENEFLRVKLHGDGTFNLTDKAAGREVRGLGLLVSEGDCGDEYDFSPAEEGEVVTAAGVAGIVRVADAGTLSAAVETEFLLPLPAGISPDRKARRPKRVACRAVVRVTLKAGSPLADLDVRFDNRVEDHRLRMRFPTGIRTGEIRSDGHFLVNRRTLAAPSGEGWVQPPVPSFPQQEFSLVTDGEAGLAVFARGLHEAEARRGPDGGVGLEVTLLRAVGWLSRDDFASRRRMNAGPTLYTPEAQCPGERRYRLAVMPFRGDFLDAGVKSASRRWRVPLLAHQGVLDGAVPGGSGLFAKESRRVSVTAVKRHEERNSLVVRLVNLAETAETERLSFGLPVRAAFRAGLLEDRGEPIPVEAARTVVVALGPHEIASLEVEFGAAGRISGGAAPGA